MATPHFLRSIAWGSRKRIGRYAFGSTVTAGLIAWQNHEKLRLDSPQDPSEWKGKSTVTSHDASLANRFTDINGQGGTRKYDADHSRPGQQSPPSQTKRHERTLVAGQDTTEDDVSAWEKATNRLAGVGNAFTGFDFGQLGDKIADMVMPHWVKELPGAIKKLQNELSMAPWSLSWEIWEDAHDPEINPEIIWDARVRVSDGLCLEEQIFKRKRQKQTAKALARYLGVPESEIHPEDVPTIAMCGSGGGLRALVAGTSSYLCAHEAGLFDCVTYTAGVSGSCWLQSLYYSSISHQSHANILNHLKQRLDVHIAFPPAALDLVSQAPTNKFLLSGMIEKLRGIPDADFGLVDIYGLLLGARLLIPKGGLRISDYDLKVSNQRWYTDKGHHPLPLYTAVRHEIPPEETDNDLPKDKAIEKAKKESWFQWFEWSPYEFYSEELQAGIPTWAVGRQFEGGRNVFRENGLALPELRIPLLMGIWGSAFCATLSHYYKEIRPIVKGLAGFGGIDSMIAGKDEELVKVHPIDPATIPNYAKGMANILPSTAPESINTLTHLQLMDAGMSNNLPIYPLLRPGRDVDIIIAFDASADVKTDNWIRVADGYAKQRGIKGWPIGAGWPPHTNPEEKTIKELDEAQAATSKEADDHLREAQQQDSDTEDLGYCTVWVGTKTESTTPAPAPSRSSNDSNHQPASQPNTPTSTRLRPTSNETDAAILTSPTAGLTLIYFPLLANPLVPGVDPLTSDFMSTWNFVYTPEEIDSVVALARANFNEGREQTRRTVRAVWERKREGRLRREGEEREWQKRGRVRSGRLWGKKGNGDHGDHFS
ncbi:hypothetical protein MBLNU230_g5187t1 [Neophaeotheca triangularis]